MINANILFFLKYVFSFLFISKKLFQISMVEIERVTLMIDFLKMK